VQDGDTPLLKAVRNRSFDIVQTLLEKGAKVSACDKVLNMYCMYLLGLTMIANILMVNFSKINF